MADLKDAMRSGDSVRRETIRFLRAALQNARIERGAPLDDAAELAVLSRLVKQHQESIEQFQQAGRDELVAKEQQELELLRSYMPAQLGPDEIEAEVRQAIAVVGAQGPREQGQVMAWLAPRLRGRADMRLVSQVVQRTLTEST